jgi:ABC-type multidrug transport system ATPase subunit
LDPNGIIEIRELLVKLVSTGKTVFISSHLLAEIEKMATHVGIINNGKLMFQGTIHDLQNISQPLINIETDNTVDAANLLKRHNFAVSDINNDRLFVPFTSKQQVGEINALLVRNNIAVFGINKQHKDLEKLFLDITKSN